MGPLDLANAIPHYYRSENRQAERLHFLDEMLGWDRDIRKLSYKGYPYFSFKDMVNISYLNIAKKDEKRVEVRFLRPQKSFKQFVLLCKLFHLRMEHLRRKRMLTRQPLQYRLSKGELSRRDKFEKFLRCLDINGIQKYKYFAMIPALYQDFAFDYLSKTSNFDVLNYLELVLENSVATQIDSFSWIVTKLSQVKDPTEKHFSLLKKSIHFFDRKPKKLRQLLDSKDWNSVL